MMDGEIFGGGFYGISYIEGSKYPASHSSGIAPHGVFEYAGSRAMIIM